KKMKIPVAPPRASSHNEIGSLVTGDVLRTTSRKEAAPLKELDDWDDFVATRYQPGKSEDQFRNYRAEPIPPSPSFTAKITPIKPWTLCSRKKPNTGPAPRQEEYLGNGGIFEYAGGRKRSGHGPKPDRAPSANFRGDSPGRPSAL